MPQPQPLAGILPSDLDPDSDSNVIFLGSCRFAEGQGILPSDSESEEYADLDLKGAALGLSRVLRNSSPVQPSRMSLPSSRSDSDVIVVESDSGSDADDKDSGRLSSVSS
jgi:hypothetical protein